MEENKLHWLQSYCSCTAQLEGDSKLYFLSTLVGPEESSTVFDWYMEENTKLRAEGRIGALFDTAALLDAWLQAPLDPVKVSESPSIYHSIAFSTRPPCK